MHLVFRKTATKKVYTTFEFFQHANWLTSYYKTNYLPRMYHDFCWFTTHFYTSIHIYDIRLTNNQIAITNNNSVFPIIQKHVVQHKNKILLSSLLLVILVNQFQSSLNKQYLTHNMRAVIIYIHLHHLIFKINQTTQK